MKRICDYKGIDALTLMGDLMDYFTAIFSDKTVRELPKGSPMFKIFGAAMKGTPETIIEMAARVRDIPAAQIAKEWTANDFWELFSEMYSSMEIRSLFTSQSQAQTKQPTSTGSAMENTEDGKN